MIYERWWIGEYEFEYVQTILNQQIYQSKNGNIRLLYDDQKELLGFYCFSDFAIDDYQQVPIWLTYLYVKPDYRQQDLGSLLFNEALTQARSFNIPQLFILTDKQTQYYQKLGCQNVDICHFHGRLLHIMCSSLREQSIDSEELPLLTTNET